MWSRLIPLPGHLNRAAKHVQCGANAGVVPHRLGHSKSAEDDRAATFFTYYAEHVGDMFGLPGEGKSFNEPIVHILRFRDGKVCEHWRVENELSMMKQFGRLPGSFEYEATAETMKDWERDRMKIGPRDG